MAVLFETLGFTFEKLEKEGEVSLVKAFKATGRLVVPNQVDYEGKTYTVTKVGGLSHPLKKKTNKQKWVEPEDKTQKGYYRDFDKGDAEYWEDAGGVYFDSILNPLEPNGGVIRGNYSVSSVVLPNTIKELGENCFKGSRILESINIPQGITKIPSGAFYCCNSLKSINIPNTVVSIGPRAFLDCLALHHLELPDTITEIGIASFFYCIKLETNIPKKIKKIDYQAFFSCSNLKSIAFPEGLYYIGEAAFFGCDLLEEVTISSSVKTICQSAFDGCPLKKVNILNEECDVVIEQDAFPSGVEIKYLGKKEVKETSKKEDTQNVSIPKEREIEVVKPEEEVKTQKETETPLQVKKDTTNKPVGVATETVGKYKVQKNDNGSFSVYEEGKLCSNTKGALRKIAEVINLEVDSNWTTRQLGAKVMKALK